MHRVGPSYASYVLHSVITVFRENLRLRIDDALLRKAFSILLREQMHLQTSPDRLDFHWPELWLALLQLFKFMVDHFDRLEAPVAARESLLQILTTVIMNAVIHANAFLPSVADYVLLMYEIVRHKECIERLFHRYERHMSISYTYNANPQRPLYKNVNNLHGIAQYFFLRLEAEERRWPGDVLDTDAVKQVIQKHLGSMEILIDKLYRLESTCPAYAEQQDQSLIASLLQELTLATSSSTTSLNKSLPDV